MTDERIIELLQRRDEQGIRECIATYGAYCHKIASGILPVPSDAEEAVADTWLKVWDAIPPQQPTHLRLFLGRIARNCALSVWRRENARCRGGGELPLVLEELSSCADPEDSPEEQVNIRELSQSISRFLKSEPALRRQVFVRRYYYLEDIPSIANQCGLRQANVRMMLSRTRQKLKTYLKQEGYIL